MAAVGVRDARRHAHGAAEVLLQLVDEIADVMLRQVGFALLLRRDGRMKARDLLFERAHRQLVVHAVAREQDALLLVLDRQKHLRVADGKKLRRDELLDLFRQFQEARRVRDGRTALADLLGDLGLRQVEPVLKRTVRDGLLNRVQVFALKVLRRRHDRRRLVVGLDERDANLRPPRELRRAEATLARDQLIAALRVATHGRRLNEPVVLQRLGEFLQLLLAELAARLVGRALDVGDLQLQRLARDGRRRSAQKPAHARAAEIDAAAEAVLALISHNGDLRGPRCLFQVGISLVHGRPVYQK